MNKVATTIKTLATKRLVLRIANGLGEPFIVGLYNRDDFLKFVGDKKLSTVEDVAHDIQHSILDMCEKTG